MSAGVKGNPSSPDSTSHSPRSARTRAACSSRNGHYPNRTRHRPLRRAALRHLLAQRLGKITRTGCDHVDIDGFLAVLRVAGRSDATVRAYAQDLRRWERVCGDTATYVAGPPAGQARRYSSLRAFWRWRKAMAWPLPPRRYPAPQGGLAARLTGPLHADIGQCPDDAAVRALGRPGVSESAGDRLVLDQTGARYVAHSVAVRAIRCAHSLGSPPAISPHTRVEARENTLNPS